jgi:glucan phosphoethanolaminetransferase (alkaline phosphatase superfamily)
MISAVFSCFGQEFILKIALMMKVINSTAFCGNSFIILGVIWSMPGALRSFRRFISFCTSLVVFFLIPGMFAEIFDDITENSGKNESPLLFYTQLTA